jgi:hypothetical protein
MLSFGGSVHGLVLHGGIVSRFELIVFSLHGVGESLGIM